jgi:hypothetical protein
MHIYKVSSPNMPEAVYVGHTEQTGKARWKNHKCLKGNDCMSKYIVAAGGASLDILETVTDPAVNMADREFFHIMRFKDEGLTVLNENMPGAIARAGGINAYMRQYRKENPESTRIASAKSNKKRSLPLMCDRCGCMSSKKSMTQHQGSAKCQAAHQHQHQPTAIVQNITATTVYIYNK